MKKILENIVVLFLDCQATGPNPNSARLLEIGWVRSDQIASDTSQEVCFVKAPDDFAIPARVARVTGIADHDVHEGETPAKIWKKLERTARQVAEDNNAQTCVTVIHFARYELPYVQALHKQYGHNARFPFDVICTHEIARRLFPELPRRGIKALAGFFGYSSSEKRRCQDHLQATACIWQNIVHILARDYSVKTYKQLKEWLTRMPVRSFRSRSYPMKDQYRRHLPDAPGVYRMCRSNNDVLYVGKARSLKKRVNSYFKKRGHHADHILDMLTQARKIRVIATESALEAALLESDLIKKHNPPYNVALRRRQREILYCNSTFTEFTTRPSSTQYIGPLTSKDPLSRLSLLKPLVSVVGSRINKNVIQEILTLSPTVYPGINQIEQGIGLFIERNQEILSREPVEYGLYRLGQHIWQSQGDLVVIDDDGEISETSESHWSPETVARSIENIIMRSMHALRRARLCVLLAESSLAWEEVFNNRSRYQYLVFKGGAVSDRGELPRRKRPPVPPGYKRKFTERQRAFDISAVDRMRVLITELRRIVDAGQWVRIRLRPRVILDNKKLQKIFTWI